MHRDPHPPPVYLIPINSSSRERVLDVIDSTLTEQDIRWSGGMGLKVLQNKKSRPCCTGLWRWCSCIKSTPSFVNYLTSSSVVSQSSVPLSVLLTSSRVLSTQSCLAFASFPEHLLLICRPATYASSTRPTPYASYLPNLLDKSLFTSPQVTLYEPHTAEESLGRRRKCRHSQVLPGQFVSPLSSTLFSLSCLLSPPLSSTLSSRVCRPLWHGIPGSSRWCAACADASSKRNGKKVFRDFFPSFLVRDGQVLNLATINNWFITKAPNQ